MYLAALQITVYTRCRSGWMPLLAYAIKFSISLSVYVQLLFHFPIHFVLSLFIPLSFCPILAAIVIVASVVLLFYRVTSDQKYTR